MAIQDKLLVGALRGEQGGSQPLTADSLQVSCGTDLIGVYVGEREWGYDPLEAHERVRASRELVGDILGRP
jgi:hypothetical protein